MPEGIKECQVCGSNLILWRGRFYRYRGEIREKNLFFELLPGHRHPVPGRGTAPVVKIGIEIIPNFVDVGSTELIL